MGISWCTFGVASAKKEFEKHMHECYLFNKPFDSRKLDKLIKDQEKTLNDMETYISQKETRLANNESLGINSRRRLEAIKSAHASLTEYMSQLKVIAAYPIKREMINDGFKTSYKVDSEYIKLNTETANLNARKL